MYAAAALPGAAAAAVDEVAELQRCHGEGCLVQMVPATLSASELRSSGSVVPIVVRLLNSICPCLSLLSLPGVHPPSHFAPPWSRDKQRLH